MKKEKHPTVGKIEIDDKTHDVKLVEVDIDEVPAEKSEDVKPETVAGATDINVKKKSGGKQLSIQGLFIPDSEKTIDARQKRLKRILSVSFAVIILAAVAYTAYRDFGSGKELASAGDILKTLLVNWFYLPCALAALFFSYFFKGFKLSFCAKHLTGKWFFKTCMETAVVGHYYNYITPLAVGGQPFEIYYLSKHGVHGGVAASLPIATYFASQFAFTALGIAALLLLNTNALSVPEEYFSSSALTVASGMAIVGLVLGVFMPLIVIVFCITPRIGATIVHALIWLGGKLHVIKNPERTMYKTMRTVISNSKCLKKITANPLVFIATFLMGVCEQLAILSIAYFTLRFFGFDLPASGFFEWMQMIQVCVILQAAVSFFPTPGNSVAADLSFYFLFETGLKLGGFAFPAMLTWRFLSYYSYLIIGFILLAVKRHGEKNRLNNKF